MAAEYIQASAPLPLLFEPDAPSDTVRTCPGWRGRNGRKTRHTPDDIQGAVIQWSIVQYFLTEARRRDLASAAGVEWRAMQMCLNGIAWVAYTAPVLRALDRLGISCTSRGRWKGEAPDRPLEVLAASRQLMARAAEVLEGEPMDVGERDQLVSDLRLLSLAGGR